MAMSAKERKQKQLEREREQLRYLDDATYPYLAKPFHSCASMDPNWESVTLPLELAGFNAPVFETDEGPEKFALEDALPQNEDPRETFAGFRGSIGRAEVMVDMLLDAASELAQIINGYKAAELSERRAEIERSDLATPEERKIAFEAIETISKIEGQLEKNVRRTLPQWKVKGV